MASQVDLKASEQLKKIADRAAAVVPRLSLPGGMPLMNQPDDWTCQTAYEGTYEREILRLLGDLVNEGDLVVDVGANVGIISARAAGLVSAAAGGGLDLAVPQLIPACRERLEARVDREELMAAAAEVLLEHHFCVFGIVCNEDF